ncbi:hypothetical protein J421_0436 [Gemmatirosa kalamazoonensis]|uniref:Uncharacterized protein n=1 Tax=Gemmatirosa kalamazoonensis TaxID=861299 RepID=W0RF15_9BACT|nr:hypothetical protein [Gemmatirosa kalamazoonensis]AHG87973.1 hypothetical protein J421_0436 [Gemmatirosa kalamazoonensis]
MTERPENAASETAGSDTAAADTAADTAAGTSGAHEPPHPPFARSPDDYTDPPGHHRRGPHGPALDVGA